MTEQAVDTWLPRELPVLQAVVARFEDDPDGVVQAHDLAAELNTPRDEVLKALRNLHRGRYVVGASNEIAISDTVFDITERALRVVGQWPTPERGLERMVAALEAIEQNTDDEDTRTRARKLLDGLGGAGRHIGLSVATAVVTGQIPGSS